MEYLPKRVTKKETKTKAKTKKLTKIRFVHRAKWSLICPQFNLNPLNNRTTKLIMDLFRALSSWELAKKKEGERAKKKTTQDALGSCGRAKTRRRATEKKQGLLSSRFWNIWVKRSKENRIIMPCNYIRWICKLKLRSKNMLHVHEYVWLLYYYSHSVAWDPGAWQRKQYNDFKGVHVLDTLHVVYVFGLRLTGLIFWMTSNPGW